MATFYLLPPRTLLADRLAVFLKSVLPGLEWIRVRPGDLADMLTVALADEHEGFLVHREELPDGEDVSAALCAGFGAQDGDDVIEVRAGQRGGELTTRRWRIAA
jgi:hypothetical protein